MRILVGIISYYNGGENPAIVAVEAATEYEAYTLTQGEVFGPESDPAAVTAAEDWYAYQSGCGCADCAARRLA